jgi:hypothetical protein
MCLNRLTVCVLARKSKTWLGVCQSTLLEPENMVSGATLNVTIRLSI